MLNYNPPINTNFKINSSDFLFLIGSCFTTNIGELLKKKEFNLTLNPNGIVFNPHSIAEILQRIIQTDFYETSHLVFRDNKWCSYLHHSSVSSPEKESFLNLINTDLSNYKIALKNSRYLIITFGSSFAYLHNLFGKIVANCHKQPQQHFKKINLTLNNLVEQYQNLFQLLFFECPDLKIILTVSPVKHLRDGVENNAISKSILRLLCNELVYKFPNKVDYFAAYELVTDDLRDYKFYKDNFTHPNADAVNYIFEKFILKYQIHV
ncbi:MAG: GSCFA domain-containing protein [Bacteroidetes bacterium]|nr:GSCFA domain-containing protein [Bacteroidota bacterium]